MENLQKFIKIPQVQWLTGLISLGVIVYIGAKVYGTIVQGQVTEQQKKINNYILADWAAKDTKKNA